MWEGRRALSSRHQILLWVAVAWGYAGYYPTTYMQVSKRLVTSSMKVMEKSQLFVKRSD